MAWLSLIETFVDPGRPAAEQVASCSTLVGFIIQKKMPLSQIVKEMENYLTTSDIAIRSRGILLLGEIWTQLSEYPMNDTVIHTFASFFAARLEDWHALRGALLGCLALLKREKHVGSVNKEDVRLLAKSALQNLEPQTLAQADRMLCLELFEVLLIHHQNIVASLGASFVEHICVAIEGEKDPRCLLIAFHIVELVMKLVPDFEGDLGQLPEEIFSIISCYFPISFNPMPDDKRGITREDLSVALMHCFASSTSFGTSAIQLFLEKLSSSLRIAKLDSLKFLGFCCMHYGSVIVQKHTAEIWASLKLELFPSQKMDTMNIRETDELVFKEALECFKSCIAASHAQKEFIEDPLEANSFLQMVLKDSFFGDFLICLPTLLVSTEEDSISLTRSSLDGSASEEHSVVVERAIVTIRQSSPILAAAVNASGVSCFSVLKFILKSILEVLRLPEVLQGSDILAFCKENIHQQFLYFTDSVAVAVLGMLNMIMKAAADVAEDNYIRSNIVSADISLMTPLQFYLTQIVIMFAWMIVAILQRGTPDLPSSFVSILQLGVAGLHYVASFPLQVAAVPENQYKFILSYLTWIINEKSDIRVLWDAAVDTVACLCVREEKFSYDKIGLKMTDPLVQSLVCNLSGDKTTSIDLSLKALAAICKKGSGTSINVVKGITKVICKKLQLPSLWTETDFITTSMLLQGFSEHILPCCRTTIVEDIIMFELAMGIWNAFKGFSSTSSLKNSKILEGSMGVFRISVSMCNEESQQTLLSKTVDGFMQSKDICTMGLFACLIISLQPTIQLLQRHAVLDKLLKISVVSSCSAISDVVTEAIGSLLNKWNPNEEGLINEFTISLETTINMILKGEWIPKEDLFPGMEGASKDKPSENFDLYVKVRIIKLLACITKGLAMKGHVTVAEFAIILLRLIDCRHFPTTAQNGLLLQFIWPKEGEISIVSDAAAEALGFIVKGQGTFMTKDYHMIIKPLYQQRFFVSMLPLLNQSLEQADTDSRFRLCYAFGNLVSGLPTSVLIADAQNVLPLLLQSISVLCHGKKQSEVLLSVVLVLSAFLVDKNGAQLCSEHVSTIVNGLLTLIRYPFSMMVRETSLLCLGAVVALPHARVFPLRNQVEKALLVALDDPKRVVRGEAIRCRRAWEAMTC